MSNPKWEEMILAVATKHLFKEVGEFQGVLKDEDEIEKIYNAIEENFIEIRRGNPKDPTHMSNNAEIHFDFKQPIPYVVIRRGDEVFCYERLGGGGESRLHNKLSIGVGGHMNREVGDFQNILNVNVKRELEEEVLITSKSPTDLRIIGILNDDGNEVSMVHICILANLILGEDDDVTVKETDQLRGFWTTLTELKDVHYDRLESWSQISLDNMLSE